MVEAQKFSSCSTEHCDNNWKFCNFDIVNHGEFYMVPASRNYYHWIDYAKFLSIFLVVFFHSPPALDGFAELLLGLVRMPMFFFLSGLLFKREKYTSFVLFVKHRGRQLLVPYFYFFLLFYSYWLIYGKNHGNQDDLNAAYYQPVIEYLYGVPDLVCMPLWFIPCLFACQCLFYLGFRKMNRTLATIVLLLISTIPYFADLSDTPFSLKEVCRGIGFYGIASLYRKEIINLMDEKRYFLISLPGFTAVYVLLVYILIEFDLLIWSYILKTFASLLVIYPILLLMRYLSDLLGEQVFVKKIASNAIIILAFHTYSIIVLDKIFVFLSFPDILGAGMYYKLIIAVLTMGTMIVPVWFLTKYTPLFREKMVQV